MLPHILLRCTQAHRRQKCPPVRRHNAASQEEQVLHRSIVIALIYLCCTGGAALAAAPPPPCNAPLMLYDNIGQSVEKIHGEHEIYSIVSISVLSNSKTNLAEGWYYLDDHGFLTAQLDRKADAETLSWFQAPSQGLPMSPIFHVNKPLPDWLKLEACKPKTE